MSRYIDATLAKAQFTGNFQEQYPVSLIKALIDEVPTANVQEVRHAKRIRKNGYICCSDCGSRLSAIKARYCQHCGAKMDEEEQK